MFVFNTFDLKSFVLSVRVHTQTISGRSFRPECHTYILVFVWHSGPNDRPLIVWVWNLYLWRWRQYFFFETSRTIHSTQNVQYLKTGIPVKYANPKTSNQAGFCRTMDATILSRHCPSWAAHVSVSGAAFIVWRVQHTREICRRSGECRGSGSCRFYGFFAYVVWRVFNKLRFSRSSQLYEKSLQCYLKLIYCTEVSIFNKIPEQCCISHALNIF